MNYQLGMNGKLYRNTGTYASPTWSEISNARDVTITCEKGEADVTTRANQGWRATVGTLKELTIEWTAVWKDSDTNLEAIRSAFLNNTNVELLALTGGITTEGSEGPRVTCEIMSFGRDEALEEGMTINITAKATLADNPPEWLEIDDEGSSSGV